MGKNDPLKYDAAFKGPTTERSCRDLFFLLLFIIFWGGMGLVAWQAMLYGNPSMLFLPKDSEGQYCGYDNRLLNASQLDLTSKPYLYLLNPFKSSAAQVCVDACPSANVISSTAANAICTYGKAATDSSDLATKIQSGVCSAFLYGSKPILKRCVPSSIKTLVDAGLSTSNSSATTMSSLMNAQDAASQIVGDFTRTYVWFLAFAGGALVLSFIWLLLMRFFAGFIIWFTAFVGLLALDGLAAFFYFAWQDVITRNAEYTANNGSVSDSMTREEHTMLGLFIATGVIAVVMNLIILVLRSRIRIAIQMVKEASKAVQAMPSLLLFPVLAFLATVGIAAYWVWIELYLASASGTPNAFGFSYDVTFLKYAQWYHLFGLFWAVQFINGVNQTTIAGAVASWYWTRDKRALPYLPVFRACWRVIRYHLGSIAFGSLIIAIVQMIRAILFYVSRQAKTSKNKAIQMVLSCLQCCMACVEKVIKFISKNAYIEIAIYGDSFCASARAAFGLLTRNAFRLITIDSVASFILFLGRMFILALCGCGSYYTLKFYYADSPLNYISASVLVIMIIAYVVAGVFLFVYSMAIDTIFMCFCEDCERNDGSVQRPYFMSENLRMLANVGNIATKGKKSSVNPADNARVIKSKQAFVQDSF